MNFFKDPKYKSIRIILLLIIIVGAGWFTYSNMQLSDSNQGKVINQKASTAPVIHNDPSVYGMYCSNTCLPSCNGCVCWTTYSECWKNEPNDGDCHEAR